MVRSTQVPPCARTRFLVMMTALVTMAATFLTAADASAARFRWKADVNGDWNVPANWTNADADPDGYPKDPGDEVTLGTVGTGARIITIPANVTITVGQITVNGPQHYQIFGQGAAPDTPGTLVFDSGSAANAGVGQFGANSVLLITAPVRLGSSLSVDIFSTGVVRFFGISQVPFPRSVTKTGEGTLEFIRKNSYTGPTRVTEGVLRLRSNDGAAIFGDIDVGEGSGAALSAKVVVEQDHQIDSFFVNVKADGLLEFHGSDEISHLVMNGGLVVLKQNRKLALASLKMTGGQLIADLGSEYTLNGDVTAAPGPNGSPSMTGSATGTLHLPASRSFHVNSGELKIDIPVTGGPSAAFIKNGAGALSFGGTVANTYSGPTQVLEGVLWLLRGAVAVPGNLQVGFDALEATVRVQTIENIADTSSVLVGPKGTFVLNADETMARLSLTQGRATVNGRLTVTERLDTAAGDLGLTAVGRLAVAHIAAAANANGPSVIRGSGVVVARGTGLMFDVADGPEPIDFAIDARIESITTQGIIKEGLGSARLSGDNAHPGATSVEAGTLVVTGRQPASLVLLKKGRLTGTGTIGSVIAEAATLAPGLSPGRLTTNSLTFAPTTTVAIELNGTDAGASYDQLVARGTVILGNAALSVSAGVVPPSGASFTIIDNDAADPVDGTFAGLAEGATLTIGDLKLKISYRGGDGNDVTLTNAAEEKSLSYFLAEGATGDFFDNDILIANPNTTDAPVTLTFLKEGGSTIVQQRTVPAQGRLTVHVDDIAGLEATAASTQVTSDNRLPLIVERTMFWDASYYGGHTANAVAQAQTRWTFAEGSQGGFFDTYLLIANANAEATTATLTFLRENATPFVTTVPVAPFARKTVYAGDYPELVGGAFGVVIDATQPGIAERAMYFANQRDRLWVGGHVNTGIVAPSTSWFHAEGATGSFFNTFILLSNPQDTAANVELRFLLDNGTVVTKQKTIEAQQRLTINPAVEDARLTDAALSTVVQSDVPIVSERSMYWAEHVTPFGEGHNSTGVVSLATRWGLAEGRVGGPREFVTYILLANPSTTAAEVTVTYLRASGAPIAKTYTVPPTSRFNIDVKTDVPALEGESFGAVIDVDNDVPIAVERSLYWNVNGALWAGGTNALGTPLEPIK